MNFKYGQKWTGRNVYKFKFEFEKYYLASENTLFASMRCLPMTCLRRRFSMSFGAWLFLGLLALAYTAEATEVRGNITRNGGASGAAVTIVCGDYTHSVTVGISGMYSIEDVPDDRPCQFQVTFDSLTTDPYPFRSNPGRLMFNWELRRYGNRLMAIPR